MSETMAGLSITKKLETINGEQIEYTYVTFGSPERRIAVVDLDMGAQFDLAEVTGGAGENLEYRNLAYIAASVREIDGFPIAGTTSLTKSHLRGILKRLGADGTRAAGVAIAGFAGSTGQPTTQEDYRAAVGN